MVANKRSKGEGTWYQRSSDNMWVGSIDLPRLSDGKRRRKVVVASTEAQVKQKLKLAKTEVAKNPRITTSSVTLETWLDDWFTNIALKKIKPRTAATYRSQIEEYIKPSIGKVRLDKLTDAHVIKMHDFITQEKKLSSTTALQAHRILAVALKYAIRRHLISENPATLTDAPKRAHLDPVILTADHAKKVIYTARDDRLGVRWAAAFFTGARQGEILGLELDRVTDWLDLSWQLQRFSWEHGCGPRNKEGTYPCGGLGTNCPERHVTLPASSDNRYLEGGLWLSRPKSSSSWRILELVDPLRSLMDRRIESMKDEPNPHGLVWTSDRKQSKGGHRELLPLDGSPIDPSRDNKAWHEVLRRAGVPRARLHDARHTTASLMLEAKISEAEIMDALGHNSYVVTRGYQNIDRAQRRRTMAALSALLTPDE